MPPAPPEAPPRLNDAAAVRFAGADNGCVGGPTPFNGDHTAGVQVLNTGNFPDKQGPLRQIN